MSQAQISLAWLRRNVARVCFETRWLRTPAIILEIELLLSSTPDLLSSPRIRSAPQVAFCFAICLTKATTSSASGGLCFSARTPSTEFTRTGVEGLRTGREGRGERLRLRKHQPRCVDTMVLR